MVISDATGLQFSVRGPDGREHPVSIVGWEIENGEARPILWPALEPGHTLLVKRGVQDAVPVDPATGKPAAAMKTRRAA